MTKQKKKPDALSRLILDSNNANKGTKRGRAMIDRSLQELGLGRSIVVDRLGRVIAGNKTLEAARKRGVKHLEVVKSDGSKLIAVMRTDLDLKRHKKAKELAIADNRTSEVDLNWDGAVLAELKLDLDLGSWFNEKELRDATGEPDAPTKMLFASPAIEREIIKRWPKGTAEQIVERIITPAMAMAQFNLLASGKRSGYYISALFNPHRLETDGDLRRSRNFVDGCKSAKMQQTAAKFLVKRFDGDVHPDDFVKLSGIGWAGYGQLVYEFRPEIARDLYLRYCKRGAKVLDPCHGWGGRVIGWLAADLGGMYVGYDPSSRTCSGVTRLIEFLSKSKTRSTATVCCRPFEDVTHHPNSFDFAMTSPPYFDTEKYSDEDTNSLNRWPTIDKWTEGFYRPLIVNTLRALKKGATFVLNVGNKTYPLTEIATQLAIGAGAKCEKLDDHVIGRPDSTGDDYEESVEDFLAITKA